MKAKKSSRLRRAIKTRRKIRLLGIPRLTVYRSPRHIYAQIFSADGANVVASASTLNAASNGGDISAAEKVGQLIAERGLKAGIKKVAFDRSGYKYHGRVKALADAARNGGLEF